MSALVLPVGEFQAFLFDLDGTVADTIPLHYRSWIEALADHGATFPPALFDAMNGLTLPKTVEVLNETYGLSMPVEVVLKRKEALYLALLPSITAVPEVLEIIAEHHGRVPFAIVSGSPRSGIEATLALLGLRDRFDVVVGQEDYVNGKPDPEPFLTAARTLGVDPAACLVFEDADAGIASAKAAKMAWVRVFRAPTVAISR